ncbi:ATP-dependent Clp protease protease subunit [Streptacidiphilus sp. MAP12-16]
MTTPQFQMPGQPHMSGALAPHAAGEIGGGGLGDQVYNRLLNERIIFLGQQVDDEIANKITAQLLLLAADPDRDIYLYINSPGGSVTAGMAIYDTMQYIKNDVVTIAMGMAASMGQFLLTAGAKGKRFSLPNAEILMHQPSAGLGGSATDIRIQAQQLVRLKHRMSELIAQHSGQTTEQIIKDSDRDRWFRPEEAKEYGLIDAIMHSAADVPGGGGTGA